MSERKFVSNAFQVPNVVVDELMNKVSANAFKIYILVIRKTRGWQKEVDKISLSQFEEYTGMNRTTVIKCVRELVEIRVLTETKGGRNGNQYALNDTPLEAPISAKNKQKNDSGEIPPHEKLDYHDSGEIPPHQWRNSTNNGGEIPLNDSGEIPHTKDTITKTKNNLLKQEAKKPIFGTSKAKSTGGDGSINGALQGIELFAFNDLKKIMPSITQQQVRRQASEQGIDLFKFLTDAVKRSA